ncbi:hypothetical protein B4U84_29265 [Westiellopsis prolifica IICB1]|nr:hypothetical protein B4U84_29265 [Westiellopsis prolifica IICB1]
MTKRVVVRTETTDTHADGTTTTSKTERLEETPSSGLLEAWMALVLLLFTGLLFITTYRVVSSITQIQREQTNGVQQVDHY